MATAPAPTVVVGIRETCADCRRRKTRYSAPPTTNNRALGLYQDVAPYGNANDAIVRVEQSLVSVNFRLQQIDQTQPGGGK